MNEKLIIGLVAFALVLGGYGAFKPSTSETVNQWLGGLSGPEISSPYLQWGNVTEWRSQKGLASASTTVCTLTSPVATSTLKFASFRLDTGTATAMLLNISKGVAGATASSTNRFTGAVEISLGASAGGGITYFASSTGLGAALDTFAPSENLNFIMNNGSGAGQLAPTGSCQAAWTQN